MSYLERKTDEILRVSRRFNETARQHHKMCVNRKKILNRIRWDQKDAARQRKIRERESD